MSVATLGAWKVPSIENEPTNHLPPNSPMRASLLSTIKNLKASLPLTIPAVIDGKPISPSSATSTSPMPSKHSINASVFETSPSPELVEKAINSSLAYKSTWESTPWNDRAAIWLKAAELVSGKYREELLARTMLGQGKNFWQAEIDAVCELADFLRFSVKYAEELYSQQPPKNAPGVWNRTEYRPLEGFVFAISPFNFTAIGGNLVGVPALLGNVCIWKPSPSSLMASKLVHEIFLEAGLPPKVIQFIPCANGEPTEKLVSQVLARKELGGIHFTGSTQVFRSLWKQVGMNIENYISYPRLIGETGGKNFHLVHPSADVKSVVIQSIRSAFEYQGQKCSALSRLYLPRSMWEQGGAKELFLQEVEKIKVGDVDDYENFMGPLIHKGSYDKVISYISKAKDAGGEIIVGGTGDDSVGYYVKPTIILTKDPKSVTMVEEIFGPVLTVYLYEDEKFAETCELVDSTGTYGLTGSVFSNDREATVLASSKLRNAAGNFYINDKCTGAVVGQQPFGGSRASGTNDKAGSINLLFRFVNARSIKESFVQPTEVIYPSNLK